MEGRLRSRVSGAAASRGLVTHVARPGDCAKSDTPSLGHGTQSSNPDTALRRERQPLGIDRPDLGMLQDFAKVHEMPLRGGSRGTAGASPDANGRLDNRIPTDSRLSILPDAGKTGTDGEICHILPVGRGRIVTMSAMSEEAIRTEEARGFEAASASMI